MEKNRQMKKYILPVFLLGLMMACSQGKKPIEESSDDLQEQTESIEKSIQKLDETIRSSDVNMEKKQSEIDSLLNDI
ncbi:MAG: hypothetical protein JXR03_07215 [Cyclobacteriaceae bacterium]